MKPFAYKPRWEHVCLILPALTLLALIGCYLLGWLDGTTTAVILLFPSSFFVLLGFGTALVTRSGLRHRTTYALVPMILVSLLFLTSLTQWPMRMAFALNRSSFEVLSQRVRAGEQIATPVQAGTFRIAKAELSPHGIVCLWTDPHPGGNTGFVQCPPENPPFNIWSLTTLAADWQFIVED